MEVWDPVRVDDTFAVITGRTADFVAKAEWDRNPAAEWATDPALVGASENLEDLETDNLAELPETGGDIWTHYFELEDQMLDGGRTLHVDLRSDFNPNTISRGATLNIARGPHSDGTLDKVTVPADMVAFEDFEIAVGAEIDMDPEEEYAGSYMGVSGVFTCTNGEGDETDICRINQHTPGELTPSENNDLLQFTPFVYTPDTDWLAAGVWLTLPNREEGDFAIGAFAYGNNPYRVGAVDGDGC